MAKKHDPTTEPQTEIEAALRAENDALKAREGQILDGLIEMQDRLAKLESAQTGASATAVQQHAEQEKLDAELDALAEEFKDYPQIEVFKRRALVGVDANLDIRLAGEVPLAADPTGEQRYWHLRWFNLAKEGRAMEATAEGYEKVRWTELQDAESIVTDPQNRAKDEYVRKGDRGLEVLYKIPLKLYDYRLKREAAALKGLLTSESKLRDRMASKTAAMAGHAGMNADQAGSFVHGQTFMRITPQATERMTAAEAVANSQ